MTTAPIQPNRSPTGHDGGADPEGEALVDALAHSAFVVMGALTRIGAEHELSLTQLRVLGILRDRTPRMAELADYLGLEKSTMSGLVDRAERRGLLERPRRRGVYDRRRARARGACAHRGPPRARPGHWPPRRHRASGAHPTAGTDARVSTGVNPGRASVQGSATRSLITLAAARSRDGERLALGHHCGLGLCLGAGVLCGRRRCVDAAVGGERLVPLLAGPLQ